MEQYFEEDELNERPTVFERNNNIRRFSFETPFTKAGKIHGSLIEQLKRKTILTSELLSCHVMLYPAFKITICFLNSLSLVPVCKNTYPCGTRRTI